VQTLAREYALSLGILSRRYKIPKRRFGLDELFMKNGKSFFIEFKKKKKKPTEGQEREMIALDEYNMPNYWTDKFEGPGGAKEIIDKENRRMERD